MYYTGLDPRTLEPVTVAKTMRDRRFQRALLQFFKPENYFAVRQALRAAGRADLIGDGCDALIPAGPPREAIEANKMFLAYIFRNTHHAENIRLGGGKVDQEGLAVAVGKRDWDAAKKYITDEVVRAHSVAGTPNECRQQLESFINGGLNLPVLLPMGTQEARKQVIRMAREVVG